LKGYKIETDAMFFGQSFNTMLHRVEINLFFEQAIYLVLFASNSGGV
jgi:hypothetical protein